MSIINSIGTKLGNEHFAKLATGATATVLITTGIKAVARPVFIYTDKKTDKETKKYTAGKEFLYQVLCLGITLALLPFAKSGGLKLAEKFIKNDSTAAGFLEKAKNAKGSTEKAFKKEIEKTMEEYHNATKVIKEWENNGNKVETDDIKKAKATLERLKSTATAINAGLGGIEIGALVGSIGGLTLLAPIISHEILHPIMHTLGMEKKHDDIGRPTEVFIADAKVPEEKGKKVNRHV